jgi:hypothetical protein
MKEYLAKLNREQRAAVEHGIGEGKNCRPLLVIAGAGTGKTNTLTHRVTHLIVNGCEPSRILLLTFTRRAANTMGRRVPQLVQTSAKLASIEPVHAGASRFTLIEEARARMRHQRRYSRAGDVGPAGGPDRCRSVPSYHRSGSPLLSARPRLGQCARRRLFRDHAGAGVALAVRHRSMRGSRNSPSRREFFARAGTRKEDKRLWNPICTPRTNHWRRGKRIP